MRLTRLLPIGALIALGLTSSVAVSEARTPLAQDKALVLNCIESMEITTTWAQCVSLMFQPCVKEEVGSEGHVMCLKDERTKWQASVETLQGEVYAAITPNAGVQLTDVISEWTKFVGQKCQTVAEEKDDTRAQSAQVGCEVAEMVGLAVEYAACLDGRSRAEFCVMKE